VEICNEVDSDMSKLGIAVVVEYRISRVCGVAAWGILLSVVPCVSMISTLMNGSANWVNLSGLEGSIPRNKTSLLHHVLFSRGVAWNWRSVVANMRAKRRRSNCGKLAALVPFLWKRLREIC
jgi:hypothetical protein